YLVVYYYHWLPLLVARGEFLVIKQALYHLLAPGMLAVFLAAQVFPADAYAKPGAAKAPSVSKSTKAAAPKPKVYGASKTEYSALVVDAETGRVLYEKNAGSIRYPASLTKM